MKEVTYFEARDIMCQCPYCNEWLGGWIGDPRGCVEVCDSCGQEFKVGIDIDIDIR